jgi:CTP synthase (UTP-ammonia lyase)
LIFDLRKSRRRTNSMPVRIAVVGDFREGYEPHQVTRDFLAHAAASSSFKAEFSWLPTDQITTQVLHQFDALWIAPGSPYRSLEGALHAIRFARENNIPLGGACAGFQHVVLEYALNVLAIRNAVHAEYDPPPGSAQVLHRLVCVVAGKDLPITLARDSQAARAYNRTDIVEHYYCNFGVNPEYRHRLGALQITGWDQANEARVVELPTHPYYVATLFVPQSISASPHPLATSFLNAAHHSQHKSVSASC